MVKKNTKKSEMEGLQNIGQGILSSLQDIKEEKNNSIKEETSNNINIEKNNRAKEQGGNNVEQVIDKDVNVETSKQIKEEKEKKEKKNFMLTSEAVDMLFQLKFKYRKKDFSAIVEEAIREYYTKYIEN